MESYLLNIKESGGLTVSGHTR